MAPPITSEAVTGAARRTTSFTSCRVANEVPSEGSLNPQPSNSPGATSIYPTGERRLRNRMYWT
jgi:hypothetical protein